jgi:glucokinase
VPDQPGRRDKNVAVALEISSGTSTIALVDKRGEIRYRCDARTLWGRPAAATLDPYLKAIEHALAYAKAEGWRVRGLGVALPGSLDESMRRPLSIAMLPSLNAFPLCDALEARYGLPARLCVDIDAAALAEYYFGEGKGSKRLLYLTLNAVMGGSLIEEGVPVRTTRSYIGHVAHLPVSNGGPRCSCGKRGCINTFVSLEALQRGIVRALRRGDETSITQRLQQGAQLSLRMLREEAGSGDAVAGQLYREAQRWLTIASLCALRFYEPDMLLLSGSLLAAGDSLVAGIRDAIRNAREPVHIAMSRIERDAALIGASVPVFVKQPSPILMYQER